MSSPGGASCKSGLTDEGALLQDTQQMFDSSMSAAAIAARIQELQAAAGIKAQLVNPSGRGAGIITLTGWVALAALVGPLSPTLLLWHAFCVSRADTAAPPIIAASQDWTTSLWGSACYVSKHAFTRARIPCGIWRGAGTCAASFSHCTLMLQA